MEKVEKIKRGELVKRKPEAKKTYIKGEYNQAAKKWSLIDCADISGEILVKKGTILITNF